MNRAIIIFIKNPVLGKVKTRLAKTIGDERALEVYEELLAHTATESARVKADRFVFYSDFIPDSDETWSHSEFNYELQEGEDLGERMNNAFEFIFSLGYKQVLIIGSDCFDLTFDLIEKAFKEFDESEIVIGPAKDGGYYLLGLTSLLPELFQNKKWSTQTVFDDTLNDLIQLKKGWFELPILSDIDTEEDLQLANVKKFYRRILDQTLIPT